MAESSWHAGGCGSAGRGAVALGEQQVPQGQQWQSWRQRPWLSRLPPPAIDGARCRRDPPSALPGPLQPAEQQPEIYGKLIIDYRCALVRGR